MWFGFVFRHARFCRRSRFSAMGATLAILLSYGVGAGASMQPAAAAVLGGSLGNTLTAPSPTTPQGLGSSGMSGLQYADPAAGIDLVQPPQPNNQGDANISVPLTVPAGRAGVQPNLSLNYSSSAGDGWVGLGWSLDVGSVDVDTRWGAPRYLATKESETYSLDGDELAPTAVRSTLQNRVTDRADWTRRVETSFERIIRHGSAPSNYWWEVTDKNGTTRLYGARSHYDAASGGYVATRDATAILTDSAHHEFRWGLTQVRDISGNTVEYTYKTATGHDVGAAKADIGQELYLTDIAYTGSVANGNDDDPAYEVKLVRDGDLNETARRDVVINAKGGFLEVTADLLRHVDIYHRNALVKRYDISYTAGAFGKSLLTSVGVAGSDGKIWQRHTFDYYDEVRDGQGNYNGFATPQAWSTGSDNLHENLLSAQAISALGGSLTQGGDGRAYIGFNLADPLKDGSFGGSIAIKGGDTEAKAEMLDINGDGLPDKVFVDGSGVSYRLNQSGPSGTTTFGAKGSVVDLDKLSREAFVEAAGGPEAYVGLTVQFNVSAHFDIGTMYFTDVNADGLPDFVDGGTVYFDHLDNGVPTFSTTSAGTAVPIDPGTAATLPDLPQLQKLQDQQNAKSPLVDTVRRWIAPWSGHVAITGAVTFSPQTGSSSTSDGVRVAVQREGDELWSHVLTASGQSATPSGVTSVAVTKGDAIYFRVGSVADGVEDHVSWDPTISYTDVTDVVDADGLSQTTFHASADFTTAGRPGTTVIMPLDGNVQFSATVHKAKVTSDDVTVRVLHNGTAVIDKKIAGSFVGDAPVSADFAVSAPSNSAQDTVQAKLAVDSPIDVTALSWTPDLHYTSATDSNGGVVPVTDPTTGQPSLSVTVPTDTDIYPETNLAAPQAPWTSTLDRDVSLTPHVTFPLVHDAGQIALTVKDSAGLVAEKVFDVAANGGLSGSLGVTLHKDTKYWVDLSIASPRLAASILSSSVSADYNDGSDHSDTVPSARHWADQQGIFPDSYRGWGYAGYNGNNRENDAIDQNSFVFDKADFPTQKPTGFDDTSYKDPAQGKAYVYTPYVLNAGTTDATAVWRGTKDSLYGGAGDAQSSRLASDSLSLVPAIGAGQQAVDRLSVSPGLGIVAGVGPLSGSFGWGPSLGLLDYTDLNGDGYPDIVAPGHVQYTGPRGGYVDSGDGSGLLDVVSNDTSIAGGGGFDGSALEIKANSKGQSNTSQAAPGAITKASHSAANSSSAAKGETADDKESGGKVGISLGVSTSTSNEPASGAASFDLPQQQTLSDVNGDGLPDRVSVRDDVVYVHFNTGYGFSSTEVKWADASRFENGQSVSATAGPTLGFNIDDLEFAGGLALSEAYDAMKTTWADVNGDGILDKLTRDNGAIDVSFGTGSGLLPAVVFGAMAQDATDNALLGAMPLLTGDQVASGHDVGLDAGADFTFGIGPLCLVGCYIIVNPGGHYDRSVSNQQIELVDVNGDGLPDSVSSTADSGMSVRENLTGRTNLLKDVHNPLGGAITIGYQRAGNTTTQPMSKWVMSRVDVDDGRPGDGVNDQATTYTYDGDVYNYLERADLGSSTVTEKQIDVTNSNAVLRIRKHTYLNDNIFDSGLETDQVLQTPNGTRATETVTDWRLVDLATGQVADVAPTASDPAGVRLLTMAVTPQMVKTTQNWYDSTGALGESTHTSYAYDSLGGVTHVVDDGESELPSDDLVEDITYSDCTASGDSWVHLPATLTVHDGSGKLLRERDGSANLCANGAITHLVETTGGGTQAAVTDLGFDAWGDYNHIEYPENANGQRSTVDYVYDGDRHTDIASVTDAHGLTATASYDGATGQVTSRTDPNGAVTSYTYDPQGRLASVTMPKEQGTGHHTIDYDYHPTAADYAYAVAHHFDAFHPDDPIDTVAFDDGIGRQTETKHDATLFQGAAATAADRVIVSGATSYDAVGRPVQQWYPTDEPLGQLGTYNYNTTASPTSTTYTVTDLPLVVTEPNLETTSTAYGFGGSDRFGATLFRATQTDELGKTQDTYSDVRGNVLGVEERPGTNGAILTRYGYDALGELTVTVDAKGNTSTNTYDLLGRRTSTNTPDAGLDTFGYDPASNLVSEVTPNLRAAGQQTNYGYDIDRLVSIDYPGTTPDVTYTYGAAGADGNGAGRIVRVQDGARDETLTYDQDGAVTQEKSTMLLHNLNDDTAARLTFTTSYAQDSFDRYRTVTYPDGEVLSYGYDSGGLVSSAVGTKAGINYPYVTRREYDEFSAQRYQQTGEGVASVTNYDPLTRRVSQITSTSPTIQIQNLNYTYDPVGNVLKTDNALPAPSASLMGGPSTQQFTYDQYYRLTSANGSYSFAPNKVRKYTDDLTYSLLGDLLTKKQTDTIYNNPKKGIAQHDTTYTLGLDYTGAPHQVTHIANQTYTHDPDGNFTGWTDDSTGQNRSVTWNAADETSSVADQGSTTRYTYDDSGRLAIQRGPFGEIAFVNQWYTVDNGTVAWKQIWVGDDRVATQHAYDDGTSEDQRYFLHKDLQGDTNIVTDPTGKIYEHFEYFPSGEIWVQEHSDTHHTPYTFAGGYFDEMRQLLDFGQRWYEPREQFFYRPDPVLTSAPTRAVDDPDLLSAYPYAEDNPVRLVDRDGRAPEDVQSAFRAAFSRGDGSLDVGKLSAFNSLALERLSQQGGVSSLGKALGTFLAAPGESARKAIKTLTETLGSKPLVSLSFTKTDNGYAFEEAKVSPTFGFKEFTLHKRTVKSSASKSGAGSEE